MNTTTRLIFFSCLSQILIHLLAYWTSYLPLFDASPDLVQTSKWSKPLLRWDMFHFAHIAEQGYVYEHEWAFFPGLPFVLSFWNANNMLWAGGMISVACDTTLVLYRLSLYHFESPNLAFLVALLSLLPSSPATMRMAPYNEPFFTYFSYRGLLYCTQSKWFFATLCFALAGAFRSNGVLLSGFILWGILIQPFLESGKPPTIISSYIKSVVYTATIFTPFVYHQVTGYIAFCTSGVNAEPWCSKSIPVIYSHVQSKYWNSGFMRYWTLAQLPNFIIAAPPFIVIFAYSVHILRNGLKRRSSSSLALIPHAIHACILCCTLLFTSHVQIILRLAPSMPLLYWAAAWLFMCHPKVSNLWIGWSVVWGATSVLLWSVFLPPA
ncbi:GPI mannosyltransferase 2 [Rhodocollybia butyracea]|uniref:GPI mannosyltransferase 2 n=1 Tax=Rhodocollybia butyracea TaxID=206335 RepID=A0A9P5PZH4_9AGAR|nr:GPI mannosyltransferase 2 [Rhodocollybia butyracea]